MSTNSSYIGQVHALLDTMMEVNAAPLNDAAILLADAIARGGIIHTFGSGHSSLLAQEIFYRAGGLASVNAMLDINLTIFGTSRPTWVERLEGYAPSLFASYDVLPGEPIIILSNSGINPVPIEMALEAKKRDLTVIAVGSSRAYADAVSRHSSGQTLFDVADIVLDTCVPLGDAIHELDSPGRTVGAVSTLLGSALLNELVIRTATRLQELGEDVPLFTSQNIPGGDEANAALIARYRPRIPLMKP